MRRRAVAAVAWAACGASLWLEDNSTCPLAVTVQVKAGQRGFRNYWLELDDSDGGAPLATATAFARSTRRGPRVRRRRALRRAQAGRGGGARCEGHLLVEKLAAAERARRRRRGSRRTPRTGGQWLRGRRARGRRVGTERGGRRGRRRRRRDGPSRPRACGPCATTARHGTTCLSAAAPTTTFCVWRDPRERAVSAYRHPPRRRGRCGRRANVRGARDGAAPRTVVAIATSSRRRRSATYACPFAGLAEAFERLARARGMADVADARARRRAT